MGWVSMAGFIELLSNLSSRRYMCDGMKNRKRPCEKIEANKKKSAEKLLKSTRFSFWDFLDTTASQRYTAPMLSSRSLGMFPTSVFGSWLAGRPLFAALSATPLFKTETQP